MNTSISFIESIGGYHTSTTPRLKVSTLEIGGRLLREWIESIDEDRDPIGWVTAPIIFLVHYIDTTGNGVSPINDDDRYLVHCVDSTQDRLGADDIAKWCPSLKLIKDAIEAL